MRPEFQLILRRLQLGSGVVPLIYLFFHLVNHALGIWSLDLAGRGLTFALARFWRVWCGIGWSDDRVRHDPMRCANLIVPGGTSLDDPRLRRAQAGHGVVPWPASRRMRAKALPFTTARCRLSSLPSIQLAGLLRLLRLRLQLELALIPDRRTQ